MIVAGGLNILTSSDSFAGLSRGFFLSQTGNCKVFDDGADGYCRADAIGSLVLKRLSDAERDNDNILGLALSTATNHSANSVSITHPHAPTQESLYRQVLREAGVRPQDVDLVKMHGTGTQAGDAAEMESVTGVFSPPHPRRFHPLHISSVKANVGHGEAAAGVTSMIKALLIFQRNSIPRHVGIKTTLNSRFPNLDRLNVHIPHQNVPWPHCADRKRYIMVNNFSAAGGNTSLLLEEPPSRRGPGTCAQTRFVVTASARSRNSLRRYVEKLILFLTHTPSVHLPSLAYTTTARRMHHKHRIAVHGASVPEITAFLQQRLPSVESAPIPQESTRVAFVFSGQGSFYRGVSRQLFEEHPPYRKEVCQLDEICIQHKFGSILPVITYQNHDLTEISPLTAQLATVCVQIALCRLWESLSVLPDVVIGASLGEYAALYAAGALSANDAIYLAGQRAVLMQRVCSEGSHAMLAVQATVSELHQVAQGDSHPYEISCVNGPRSITVSGLQHDITALKAKLEDQGYRTILLNVPFAFHSSQMDSILEQYEIIANRVVFRPSKVPMILPTLADTITDSQQLSGSYMRDATRKPVRFAEALRKARDAGALDIKTVFIEIGIHPTYSGAVRANMPTVETVVPTLKFDEDNWCTLAATMAVLDEVGIRLDWNEWYKPVEKSLRLLDLPSYQWDLAPYWLDYKGDWLLLKDRATASASPSPLRTSLVHQVVEDSFWVDGGMIVIQSDVMDDDFYAVASGHKMSGRPLVSVFAYTDIALLMDFGQVRIFQGLIPRKDRSRSQWIRARLEADLKSSSGVMQFSLRQVLDNGQAEDLATAVVTCGDSQAWLDEWSAGDYTHLLTSRIDALRAMADRGEASRMSKDLVYTLFKTIPMWFFRPAGKWTTPPHHVDPLTHVGGLVLNIGLDDENTVYVMEGWKSMRFAQAPIPGKLYRCYVKMGPQRVDGESDSGCYTGDVHILRGDEVVGKVLGLTLRPLPRILMSRFFDPPDEMNGRPPLSQRDVPSATTTTTLSSSPGLTDNSNSSISTKPMTPPEAPAEKSTTAKEEKQLVRDALALIASEVGVEVDNLTEDTHLSEIGVDSLLSLVLAEKFTMQLKTEIRASFFLESPTIGDIKMYFGRL
ncbi:uncharacterized protein BDV17DRAFT_295898 [Aspergillus undulatus]|uniref:uncharacterized protein n=1 Tax=Aspergillus undulatus TaxID=1810928 RepID=UPI003CCE3880